MTVPDGAREAILGRIRSALAASAEPDARERRAHPPAPAPGDRVRTVEGSDALRPPLAPDVVFAFRERLLAAGGQFHAAADLAEAAVVTRRILGEVGARRVAVSDAPDAAALVADTGLDVRVDPAREWLFECDTGLTTAQWGIAETGSIVLDSSVERHRLVSLLPPVHIALLRASRVTGTLGEALDRLVETGRDRPGRAITLITGPSRTADIELTLVVGVHGPRLLHVIVVNPESR